MKIKILILAVVLFSAVATQAQSVPQTQKNEAKRIKQGVKSGELTKVETKKLVGEQKNIQQEKKAAKADGVVTIQERKGVKQDQRKASRHIAIAKHNKRDRN